MNCKEEIEKIEECVYDEMLGGYVIPDCKEHIPIKDIEKYKDVKQLDDTVKRLYNSKCLSCGIEM